MNSQFKNVIVVTVVLVFCAAIAGALTIPGFGKAEKVKPINGIVSIPVTSINDGKAHYFKFNDSGKDVTFFVVKGSDGAVRTAFDACDACYREKKGYEQKGNVMVCRNCNMKFPIDRLGPNATGGCNPSYLPHKVNGNNVLISVDDLRSGSKFF